MESNTYNIAGLLAVALLIIALDKGRILRDVIALVLILLLHLWMGVVALVLSPLAMVIMVIIAPVLRALGIIAKEYSPVNSAMEFVLTHTLPGQRRRANQHE